MAAHGPVSRGVDPGAAVTHVYHHPDAVGLAAPLRERFRVVSREFPPRDEAGFYLWAADDRLELRHGAHERGVCISVSELARRAARGRELMRACGAAERPAVLDAMAGWGVDGLVLAGSGCRVIMVERHSAISALQQDLVRRSGISGVLCRWGDGYCALKEMSDPDVIYLDPMFPSRRKGALPGKRMQWLAALTGPDVRPLEQWLEAARACTRGRVVLKRRRRDPVIEPPDWQIVGRTVRYDVYRASPARDRFTPPGARRNGSPGR